MCCGGCSRVEHRLFGTGCSVGCEYWFFLLGLGRGKWRIGWVVVQMPFHRRVFCGGVLMGGTLTVRFAACCVVSSTAWSASVASVGWGSAGTGCAVGGGSLVRCWVLRERAWEGSRLCGWVPCCVCCLVGPACCYTASVLVVLFGGCWCSWWVVVWGWCLFVV